MIDEHIFTSVTITECENVIEKNVAVMINVLSQD